MMVDVWFVRKLSERVCNKEQIVHPEPQC